MKKGLTATQNNVRFVDKDIIHVANESIGELSAIEKGMDSEKEKGKINK